MSKLIGSQPAALPKIPVCGIGASAGGVEALQQFFRTVPVDLGLAYVVVVHLAPDRKSELPSIIARWTTMPVAQVADHDQSPLEPNHVYVIAPDRKLEITDSSVGASTFEQPRGQRAAIDLFFRSLAATHGDGFAVVLSGSGGDGALGAKAVKASGGVVLVQDPEEAAHGDMPRNVIATGVADLVLPVHLLTARLAELARSKDRIAPIVRAAEETEQIAENEERALKSVLELVKKRTGHDFSRYKRTTIVRRLSRRLQLTQQLTIGDYWQFLRTNAQEAQALFDDLLISVTTFFRDPDTWSALQTQVISTLVERAGADEQIRVWVPGCATGEEAYTAAILFQEELERRHVKPNLIVFASDIDESALAVAREGIYPRAIATDVPDARLERYFRTEDDHFRVTSEIRDHVVFAAHSLLRDPPFSRVHLISCRNLLIYLDRDLQDQVMSVFRYACRDDGYLVLGGSESAPDDLFQAVDKKHRIFRARARDSGERPILPDILVTPGDRLARTSHELPVAVRSPAEVHLAALEFAAPPSVVVDDRWNVVHVSSSASRFFQQSGGPLARRVTEVVRPELRDELHGLLHRATEQRAPQLSTFVAVRFNGAPHRVALLAQPRVHGDDRPADTLVTFLDAGEAMSEPARPEPDETNGQIRQLREQLRQAERRIDTVRDEHSLTNEDLRAANEELQSLNEEYRSTTEELETSKEELQSINEELQTVNQELKLKLEEVSRAHSDLENLIAAADVAILFLDPDLRIKRFTPQLGEFFNVKTRDLDRPIGDLTHTLHYETLEEDARRVVTTHDGAERTVTAGDRTIVIRLRPYAIHGSRESDGVVVTFVDVTAITQAEASLHESQRRLADELEIMRKLHRLTLAAVAAPGLSDALRHIVTGAVELQGAQFGTIELIDQNTGQMEIAAHVGFRVDVIPTLGAIDAQENSACGRARQRRRAIELPDVLDDTAYRDWRAGVEKAGYRGVQCTPLISRNDTLLGFLSVHYVAPHAFSNRDRQLSAMIAQQAADLIESRQQHEAVARLNDDLRARTGELEASHQQLSRQAEELVAQDRNREAFLAGLGHELRNPLAAITSSLPFLAASDDRSRRAIQVLQRQATHMTRLVEDLLDIARIRYGKLRVERVPIELNQWIPPAVEAMRPQAEAKGIDLRHDMPPDRITVDADPERLTQILDNLLRNALTNTDHGAITVTVQRDESHARIAVRDTGTGVDAADVSGLFKPYRQHVGEGATGGLGLGLSLVKALVEAHSGTVSVDSAGRGAGSEFSFTVPLSPAAANTTRGHDAESAPSYRVLVVDDERDAADAFGGLLESLGQEVTVVYGAEDALTRAVHRRPRIAFIDVAMPEVDGWELARRLRRTFSREDLTIVAVTGHGKPPAIETIPEVDRYMLKPVSRETVVEMLNGVADGRNKPA